MINNRVKLLASRCLLRYTTAVSTRNFDFCALSTQYSPTACSRTAPRPRSPPSTGTRIWHWVSRVIHTDKRAGLAADMFANETTISLGKSKSCKKSKIRDKSEPKCQVKKQHIGPGVRLWLYPTWGQSSGAKSQSCILTTVYARHALHTKGQEQSQGQGHVKCSPLRLWYTQSKARSKARSKTRSKANAVYHVMSRSKTPLECSPKSFAKLFGEHCFIQSQASGQVRVWGQAE